MYWQDKINFLGRLLIQTECIKNTWPQQQSILLLTYITFHTEEATLTNCRRYVQALADDNLLRFFSLSWIETILRKECLLWKNNVFFLLAKKAHFFCCNHFHSSQRDRNDSSVKTTINCWNTFRFYIRWKSTVKKTNLSVAMDLRFFNNVLNTFSST